MRCNGFNGTWWELKITQNSVVLINYFSITHSLNCIRNCLLLSSFFLSVFQTKNKTNKKSEFLLDQFLGHNLLYTFNMRISHDSSNLFDENSVHVKSISFIHVYQTFWIFFNTTDDIKVYVRYNGVLVWILWRKKKESVKRNLLVSHTFNVSFDT